jgi:tartrate-resistant acid phosphatase type 5
MPGFRGVMHWGWAYALLVSFVAACPQPRPTEPTVDERVSVERAAERVVFAVIGDYGLDSDPEHDVAELVHGWKPEFIVTTGDNNYPDGDANTIDANVGKHYHAFIAPYRGAWGAGADENRFFPSLGNHDWRGGDIEAFLGYFALPGNERYYEVSWGPVDVFVIDSDEHEPDGISPDGTQAQWLRHALAAADGPWKLVVMHHAPYSSGEHGSERPLQWPFASWGATAVISGHDHTYERIQRDGIVYLVNGLGGNPQRYELGTPVGGSIVRYNDDHGALRVTATPDRLTFEFVTRTGLIVDAFDLSR